MSLIFITFIFKMNNRIFYGKYYTDNISPDHTGLDEEVKPYLLKGISEYYKKKEENTKVLPEEINTNLHIGIMSVSNEKYIAIHSSDDEKYSFDFYCEKYTINYKICVRMYMFGKLIENHDF